MSFSFIPAKETDARTIAELRRAAWATTYRGIYPDEAIDDYDLAEHEARDLRRIRDETYRVYLIADGDTPAGYFMLQDDGRIHIQSLYVLAPYRGRGAGKAAFALVRDRFRGDARGCFTCNCNQHNRKARGFYEHMGGRLIREDVGHEARREDQVTYRFDL